jgi:hypothetical protein
MDISQILRALRALAVGLALGALVSQAAAQTGGKPAAPAAPVDEDPPVVTIVRPHNGGVVSQGKVVVAGTVRDKSRIVSVTINDEPVTLDQNRFTVTVPLAAGAHSILVIATDEQGNFGTARVKVTVRG